MSTASSYGKGVILKRILVATAAALPLAVPAQSSVTVYGRFDMSVIRQNFASTADHGEAKLQTLSSDVSMMGMRGSEDLGSGARAYFKMETGFGADTGRPFSPTAFWNREAYVGLGSGSLGSLQLGAQWAPGIVFSARIDPFTRFGIGSHVTLMQGLRGYAVQYQNAVQYITPTWAHSTARVMFAAGEGAATGPSLSAAFETQQGPLFAGVLIDQHKIAASAVGLPTVTAGATPGATAGATGGAGAPVRSTTVSAGASYDWKVFKLAAWYQTNRIAGLGQVQAHMLGATAPLGGQGEFRASYTHRSQAGANANMVALGYFHFLSKRTGLYANLAKIDNQGSAAFLMNPIQVETAAAGLGGAAAVGRDIAGVQLGMRHLF